MTNPLILKLEKHDTLSVQEKQVLEAAVSRIREVRVEEDIIREGDRSSESSLILDGWAARYKLMSAGKRQITALHVPGDFVDLHSFLLKKLDHGIVALTRCRIAVVPHSGLLQVTQVHPHLTRMLWLNTLVDGAIHREWLAAMGRLSAMARAAHLLCEIYERLNAVGLANGSEIRLPLTQVQMADVLGLSTVHVNRVVQELRSQGLISWQEEILTIHDHRRLRVIGEFDPGYLNLEHERR
jgi:CRP-like cAMP-binding protein